MFVARFVQACAGYFLALMGASTLVAVTMICFAVLLLGSDPVVQYLVDHFGGSPYLEA